jgi:ADP-ribose pyrophosphatase YjhB (NUDIX family)
MERCPQFVTGEYKPTQAFLPDTEYSLALDCLTKAVSDILVFNHDQTKILLGKRKVEPQPDWWLIGGRARPGETTKEAAARNMKRETGIGVVPSRFKVVGHFSLLWHRRQQEPQENGLADISTIHVCTITESEQNSIKIDGNEYDQTDWFDWKRIRNDAKDRYHPALKQAIDDWVTSQIYDDLKEYCQRSDAKDEVIAQMARSLVGRRGEVEEVTLVHFRAGNADADGEDGKYYEIVQTSHAQDIKL